MACRIRSEKSLAELEEFHSQCMQAKDEDAYMEANKNFHSVIYREARMPVLQEMIDTLWNRLSPYVHILLRGEQEWQSDKFARHHQAMLEAMQEKDPVKIRMWLTEDLTQAAKRVMRMMARERGQKESDSQASSNGMQETA